MLDLEDFLRRQTSEQPKGLNGLKSRAEDNGKGKAKGKIKNSITVTETITGKITNVTRIVKFGT